MSNFIGEITDKSIVLASLDIYAVELWHEVESGQRYFGTTVHTDVVQRIIQIKKSIKEGGTECCLLLPVD